MLSKLSNKLWYGLPCWVAWPLLPLAWVYGLVVSARRLFYRVGFFKRYTSSLPLIVVGNVTVGGTGKTPFIIALVKHFESLGKKVAVVSRGYGGRSTTYPLLVKSETYPSLSGDEPALIAQKTNAMVVVSPKRVEAIQYVERQHQCDVILSDDGLQHYAMVPSTSVVIVDAQRQFGNRYLLPAGPLRESISRLKHVDAVFENGKDFFIEPTEIVKIAEPSSVLHVADIKGPVYAVCGIANPERFFETLKKQGITFIEKIFPDHHDFSASDIDCPGTVIMTEKDAIKCSGFVDQRHYVQQVSCMLSDRLMHFFSRSIALRAL